VKVDEILFIVWGIVFAMWLVRQFANYNRQKEKERE
jgi:hypothetical protein